MIKEVDEMQANKTTTFRISSEFNKVLDKIKAETGATKTFIVQKAVEEYYKDVLNKIEKKEEK